MSTSATVPIPQGATVGPAQSEAPQKPPAQSIAIPAGASIGHPEEGITYAKDGSFVITPKDGESFADTMNRAAQIGKTVTPDLVKTQMQKGKWEAPEAIAAGYGMGAALPAAMVAGSAGASAIPSAAEAEAYLSQYPNLLKLAKIMGIPASAGGMLLWAHRHLQ